MSDKPDTTKERESGSSPFANPASLKPGQSSLSLIPHTLDNETEFATVHDEDGSMFATLFEEQVNSEPRLGYSSSGEPLTQRGELGRATTDSDEIASLTVMDGESLSGTSQKILPEEAHSASLSSEVTGTVGDDTYLLPPQISPPSSFVREKAQTNSEPGTGLLGWHGEADKRYTQIDKLGEGGMGEVVLVRDELIERDVAMKLIRNPSVHDGVPRFLEEVRTVGRLEHPSIVPIHDIGIDQKGHYYFTMKYVEGETLESVIEQLRAGDADYHKRFSFEYRCRVFLEILHAIQFAHNAGILHRDIKPSNIMLGQFGEVMVMDWGSARPFSPSEGDVPFSPPQRPFQTQAGTLVGTPAYMSPEQALGSSSSLDQRSDIYSLCVLFYEFLSLNHYLGHKQSFQEILFGIVSETPKPADSILLPEQGYVPRELWFFLRKGLAKSRDNRYFSVDEMVEGLHAILDGNIGVHCPSTLLKRAALLYASFLDTYRTTGVFLALLAFLFLSVGVYQVGAWLGNL